MSLKPFQSMPSLMVFAMAFLLVVSIAYAHRQDMKYIHHLTVSNAKQIDPNLFY